MNREDGLRAKRAELSRVEGASDAARRRGSAVGS